ncbi:MAG TPA: FAD binding domain-containing protein, partial [Stellaceae bacterium]|nr:FAD binding domain-containing protein [Stellaceae bacterium]
DLVGVKVGGGTVTIGAMTTHDQVSSSPDLVAAIPALASLAGLIGDPAVRHRGTIGGSVANADPAADYPAGCLGLDATIVTDRREIAADDFFLDLFETALEPGEIIAAVRFKKPDRAHYLKYRHPSSGYAIVGVMVAQFGPKVRVAVTGAGPCVFRVGAMEQALEQSFAPDSVAGIRVPEDGMMGDMHCSAAYRAHLVTVYARRAVEALVRA